MDVEHALHKPNGQSSITSQCDAEDVDKPEYESSQAFADASAVPAHSGAAAVGLSGDTSSGVGLDDMGNIAREIEDLALSTALTEFAMSIDITDTLIFQVQEMRHLTASDDKSSTDVTPSGGHEVAVTSQVDSALMRLDAQLESMTTEANALQQRLERFWSDNEAEFLKQKWKETRAQWQRAQDEADKMRDELIEDKYLIVYRTVSRQAEEMMQSLEKIFAQCHSFVHEAHRKYGYSASQDGSPSDMCRRRNMDPDTLKEDLDKFITLHKSLHQKSKYYLPSCSRVLKVIDSGIAQQRSLNGEVLRSHSDMKIRWRNVQERIKRVENEMQSAQDLLGQASEGRNHKQAPSTDSSSSTTTSESRSGSLGSSARATASAMATMRRRTGDWLTPSPVKAGRKSSDGSVNISPSQSRAVSPFRRLTSRFQNGSARSKDEGPPPMPSGSTRRSSSPRPSHPSLQQYGDTDVLSTPTSNRPSLKPRLSAPQHRYSQSASLFAGLPPPPSLPASSRLSRDNTTSSTLGDRALSPLPRPLSSMSGAFSASGSTTENRPRWNGSTRLQSKELSSSLPPSKGRKSLPAFETPPRAMSPAVRSSRPASRNFTTPITQRRPPSPAFSATSNTSASSAARPRPSSPDSKIPAPASARHGRPSYAGHPAESDAMETLFFRSSDATEDGSSTILQRAFSPTPSASTNGESRRQSHIPRLSVSTSSAQNTPLTSPAFSSSARSDLMTPEPTIRSRASRASAVYGGYRSAGRPSLGLPGTGSPTGLGRSPHCSNSSASDQRRSITPSPLSVVTSIEGRTTLSGPYVSNPVDPLDVEIAAIVNSQPLFVPCERIDLPLNKAAAAAQAPSDRVARYRFGWTDGKDISCKLIDKGGTKGRKVLCRVRGGWQDLSMHLLNQQAQY